MATYPVSDKTKSSTSSRDTLPDPTPYAYEANTQATYEAGQEIGAPNTLGRTKGAAIGAGPCNEVQVTPRSPDPYASTSGTVASLEDSKGDVHGTGKSGQATYKTVHDETSPVRGKGATDGDPLEPYGYGGDARWS